MTAPSASRKRKASKANFGSVRQLSSGKWQARYPAEDGLPMKAPTTFDSAKEAWTHILLSVTLYDDEASSCLTMGFGGVVGTVMW